MIDLSIKISNSEQSYKQRWQILDSDGITISDTDPKLVSHVNEALRNFKGIPEDIDITAKAHWCPDLPGLVQSEIRAV